MKRVFIYLLVISLSSNILAQYGKVYDSLTLTSKILKMERKYAINLPPDYESSERSYPVLYLLHGHGDDQTGWVQFGEVLNITDNAIKEGKATAMIIVMPDANTGNVGYANLPNGNWNYEDFFFEEFMPYIEATYRIKSEKRYRAISGLSMGGGGTFTYALRHPELFSAACPLSASCGPLNPEDAERYLKWNKQEYSDKQIQSYYESQSVLELIKNLPENQKNDVRWYIDCGDDDFLFEGNGLVHIAMRKREIKHEFRIRDGAHNWTYWRESLPEVLAFVSMSFRQY
ncbi:MAG: esterase family protein [Bacteroidales bacterium]|nr:esterase family protein [Bacteroidales bacterium]MCF8391640.1 esterase family protein [Bacteroidales bacterium]